MELLPIGLILASALLHAVWNTLVKESGGEEAFMWLMTLASLLTLLPLFLLLLPGIRFPLEALPYLLLSGLLQALYYCFLGRAYGVGDLSFVYPIARSSPLMLLILSPLILHEEVSIFGVLGILFITLGLYILHLPGLRGPLRPLRSLNRASVLALLAALSTALYSLVDKVGVLRVGPLLYAFWLDPFSALMLTPIVAMRWSRVRETAERWMPRIILSGTLMRLSYLMVLIAMPLAQVSYLIGLRQLSVVIGSLIGVGMLGERHGAIRLLGSTLIFLGAFLIALA